MAKDDLLVSLDDMREPDLIDAMVAIIRNATIDLKTARLAATVVAIDANLQARITRAKKHGVEQARMLDLLEFGEETVAEAHKIASSVKQGDAPEEISDRLLTLLRKISSYEI